MKEVKRKMYKLVQSPADDKKFDRIWKDVCVEKKFPSDPYAPNGERYLIYDASDCAGTIEIFKYDPGSFSTIERYFDFQFELDNLDYLDRNIYEIDKVSLLFSFRSKGLLKDFFVILNNHQRKHHVEAYVALIDLKFFRALKRFYNIDVTQIGNPLECNGEFVIPSVIDARNFDPEIRNELITYSYKRS